MDLSGVVAAVGSNVDGMQIGDRVWTAVRHAGVGGATAGDGGVGRLRGGTGADPTGIAAGEGGQRGGIAVGTVRQRIPPTARREPHL